MEYETLSWLGAERRVSNRDGPNRVHFDALYRLVRAQPGRDQRVDDRLECMTNKIDGVKASVDAFEDKFVRTTTEGWTRVYKVIESLDTDIKGQLTQMMTLIKKIPCEPVQKVVEKVAKKKK